MKKVYFSLLGLVLAGSAIAQQARTEFPARDHQPTVAAESERTSGMDQTSERGAAFWTEDFSGGFDGPNGLWTTEGANADIWEYTTEIQAGCYSGGANNAAQMTTRENGFMLFHADEFNCVDATTTPPVITQDPLEGELISPAINLSDQPAVLVTFEHWFRHCCAADFEVWLSVSNDGETWTDFVVSDGTPANDYNTNNVHSVNISNVAGNQEEVYLKFTWNALAASSHYFWAIDDISLSIPPDNDMALTGTPAYSNHNPDVDLWENLEYSIYDLNQLRPLVFSAAANNVGATEQTGVFLEVNITSDQGLDETLTSDPITMAVGQIDTLTIDNWNPPATPGLYTVTYTIVQNEEDANEGNNSETRTFEISDGEFGRDEGALSAFSNLGLDEYWGGNGFYFNNDDEIHCIGAAIFSNATSPSTVGAFFDYELRAFSSTGLDFVAVTELAQVNSDMFNAGGGNNFTYLWMEGNEEGQFPVPVFAGDEYVAMFHHFGGEDAVYVGINGTSPNFSSYVIAEFETQSCAPCYTNSTYMVRLGMSFEFCEANILFVDNVAETDLQNLNVYEVFPNPTAGQTAVEYSLLDNSRVNLFLFDQQGRIVMNREMGVQTPGEYRFDFDFSNLASGVYTFSIKVNDRYENKQLVIR